MPYYCRGVILWICLWTIGSLNAQVTVEIESTSNTSGCGSLQASFCAQASSTAGSITDYVWDLGGVSSSLECPGRIFGTPGKYTICLTAKDEEGNEAKTCKEDFIHIFSLPQPDFTASVNQGCVPLEVKFEDQTTTTDGEVVRWIWGLGGENSVIETTNPNESIRSSYTLVDDYTTSLTVEDENGCLNTVVKDNFVKTLERPEIKVAFSDSLSCSPPFEVQFTNQSPAKNVSFSWQFGNGTSFLGFQPPPVQYNETGTYSVTIRARIPVSGCENILVLKDKISVGYPVDFSVSQEEVCIGEVIHMEDHSDFEADSILWDFGDGTSSDQPASEHQYTTPGTYTVTLFRYLEGCPSKKEVVDLITVRDQPQLDYTLDNGVGCILPHPVNFTAMAEDAVSWAWDFGDGTTSTLQNPTHIYEAFGEFTVQLTVINANGCQTTLSTEKVKIASLEAGFSLDNREGCVPTSFRLKDESQSVVPISEWSWEVQGLSSANSSPVFTLADTGRYDVRLMVENSLGCRDTIEKEEFLQVGDVLDVDFDADVYEVCVGAPVEFTDLSSSYADSWLWMLGDTVLFGNNPTYALRDTGVFDITLIVSQNGCVSELTKESFITVLAPRAKFKFEMSCTDPYTVVFENTSVGADLIHWDFGVEGIATDTSAEDQPVFTFPGTGEYDVWLTAYNFQTGCKHVIEKTIHITDPKAEFNLSTLQGCFPLDVRVSDNSDFAAAWTWFAPGGEINNPNSPNPVITYTDPGAYSVIQLVITDVNECTDTLVFTDTIFVNGVDADFLLDPPGGCLPLEVGLEDQSSSLYGQNISWNWDIGEGYAQTEGQQSQITFTERGSYPISLTVTDNWGCVGKKTVPDAVLATYPIAEFSADTLSCRAAAVSFTDASEGINLQYIWDFGDGTSSTEKNPQHQYTEEGAYTICLTVTDINGCADQLCKTNYVTIADPAADFDLGDTYANCPPLIVEFNNTSANANAWEWNFGDNSGTTDLESPPHVYTRPGSYTVSLIASSTPGCTDTLIRKDLIRLDGPNGNFEYQVDTSCVPVKITVMGASDDLYEYVWDFGNGDLISRPGRIDRDTFIYYYRETGIFIPKLRLIDASTNCEVVIEADESIFVTALDANFTASDSTLCGGELTTQFINLSNSNAPINFLEWTFEGGFPAVSNQLEPKVTFEGNGTFDIQLVAGNEYCRDTIVKEKFIQIGAFPVANFSASPAFGCEPFPVQFSDQSTVPSGSITNWQWNFGDEGFSYEENPSHTYNDGGSFQVELIVSSDMGCQDTAHTLIPVQEAMSVSIAEVAPICIGEEIQFNVYISDTSGIRVRWDNEGSLNCTDCIEPFAHPEDTTTYTIYVENDIGCKNSAQVTVDVRPFRVPEVTMSADTTICANDIINIYGRGGTDVFSYEWDTSSPGLSCYDNCNNPIASPEESTTYFLTVTSMAGCSSRDSVRVDISGSLVPLANADKVICRGDTVQLSTQFGEDPVWLNPTRLDCTYCPSPKAAPQQSITYQVEVTDEIGCRIQDSVFIEVIQLDEVDAGDNQSLCLGDELMLEAKGEGQISWTPSLGISGLDRINPQLSPNESTTYYLTVTRGDCTMRDSVTIEVVEKTDIELAGTQICAGEEIELYAEGHADHFQWSPVEKEVLTASSSIIVSPELSTTYSVIAQLSYCEPDTAFATVEVIPLPGVYLPPTRGFFKDQTFDIGLQNRDRGNYIYEWLPAEGLSCTDCPNPTVAPDSNRRYEVSVTDPVTGCLYEASTELQLLTACPESIIGMPNVFSPNNDGSNDELKIQSALVTEIKSYQIYDRWGGLVFETKDLNQGWDGTYRGQELQQGVYIYFIEATCNIDGSTFLKKGDVTLIK